MKVAAGDQAPFSFKSLALKDSCFARDVEAVKLLSGKASLLVTPRAWIWQAKNNLLFSNEF